jgi:hypothetical protein
MKHPHVSNRAGPATVAALLGWMIVGFSAGLAVGITPGRGLGGVCAETCAPERTPEPLARPASTSPARSATEGPRPGAVWFEPDRTGPVRSPGHPPYGSNPADSSSLQARHALLAKRRHRGRAVDEVAA